MGRRHNPFADDDESDGGARAYHDFLHNGAAADMLPADELLGANSPLFDPYAAARRMSRQKVRADVTNASKFTKRARSSLAADIQRFKV